MSEPNQNKADTLLFNGRIVTVDSDFSVQEAVAIKGDRIAAVGSNSDVKRLMGSKTVEIDLGGRTVIPGLNDAHYHFLNRAARAYFGIRLDQYTSINQILAAIREKVISSKPGSVILSNAGNGAELLEEGRTPTLAELDKVAPDNPVVLTFEDGWHVNSKMMESAGISNDVQTPPKGRIERDESGRLTGVFAGSAQKLLKGDGSGATGEAGNYTDNELYEAFKWGQKLLASKGVTSYRNPSLRSSEMLVYQRLWERSELTVRVAMDIYVDHERQPVSEFLAELQGWGVKQPFGDEWLRISGVSELWIDQSTDGMLNTWNYKKIPPVGEGVDNYKGIQRISTGKLSEIMVGLNQSGWRPLLHAGGDRAVDIAIESFEAADKQGSISGKRWVLDHAHYGQDHHIAKVKALDVIVGMQYHAYMYYPIFAEFHGNEEATHLFPARQWLDGGIIIAGGSDYSQVPVNLFDGIYFFVTRQTQKWGPIGLEHSVSREEALRMFTINSAYQTFEENIKGSLEAGKLADMLVLNDDYLTVDDNTLRHLHPVCTIVGGKAAYIHPGQDFDLPACQ